MINQALVSTQTLGQDEDLEVAEERLALLDATFDVEGNHATHAFCLLQVCRVLWVRGKA